MSNVVSFNKVNSKKQSIKNNKKRAVTGSFFFFPPSDYTKLLFCSIVTQI